MPLTAEQKIQQLEFFLTHVLRHAFPQGSPQHLAAKAELANLIAEKANLTEKGKYISTLAEMLDQQI